MEKTISILHLEDQSSDSVLVKAIISKGFSSFDYHFVDDEAGFLKALRELKIDVILSDYQIPGYSGFEALHVVKNLYPHIPFIFVTGKMGEDAAIESLLNGATDYVLKSKIERLVPAIKRVLYETELMQERMDADRALRENEEKYRNLVENVSDVIFEIDSGLLFRYLSPGIESIIGYKPTELIGKSLPCFVYEPDQQFINDKFSKLREKIDANLEYRLITRTGDICWVRTSIKPIFKGPVFIGGSGTLIDITQRKKTEEELLMKTILLETQSETSIDGILAVDKNSQVILCNNRFGELWKIPQHIVIQKDDQPRLEYVSKQLKDPEEFTRKVKYLYQHPDEKSRDEIELKDGRCFDRYSSPMISSDGKYLGRIWFFRDITERKQFEEELLKAKEKAEAGDRLKTAFIHNINHEIITPLNGILGFGPLLTDQSVPMEEKEEFLRMVNTSSDRLIKTVNDIMDISLIVSGNQELKISSFNPLSLLHEIEENFKKRCNDKNLVFAISHQLPNFDLYIDSDKEILYKILTHLVDNAVKFTIQGTITTGFNACAKEFEFFVSDTGIGIDQETQKKMYEPFMQKDVNLNRAHEGSGLGLSISKGLVELLGGHIRVESVKDAGSTFSFAIPI